MLRFADAATRGVLKKKVLLKISQISQENACVAGLKDYNLIIKRIQHRYFSVKLAEFLRTPVLKNICKRLLLNLFSLIFNA